MKTYINDKLYNNETSAVVGVWKIKGKDKDDPKFAQETLYRKKRGEYFLLCEGGCDSIHAVRSAKGKKSKGEFIQLVTYDEAQDWISKHLNKKENKKASKTTKRSDKYKGMVPINCFLPQEAYDELRDLQSRFNMRYRDILSLLIMEGEHTIREKLSKKEK
jgi:hypothetical protein